MRFFCWNVNITSWISFYLEFDLFSNFAKILMDILANNESQSHNLSKILRELSLSLPTGDSSTASIMLELILPDYILACFLKLVVSRCKNKMHLMIEWYYHEHLLMIEMIFIELVWRGKEKYYLYSLFVCLAYDWQQIVQNLLQSLDW